MKKVLVIEDNPTNMKLTQLLLEKVGCRMLTAEDAPAGIALAQQELPDLILIDIQLPGMDGLTATRLLKQDPATRHIKVFALTAQAMLGDEQRILAAGCDGYIAKPIHSLEFIQQMHDLLDDRAPASG